MASKRKISGFWRDVSAPYIKVAGTWRIAKEAWAKVDGQWKSWFLQGGLSDLSIGGDYSQYPNFATNIGSGPSGAVNAIAIQSDGKIVVGGNFTTFNGVTVNNIVRLNTDGTRDTTFTTNTGTGFTGAVNAIAIQSDGKIVVGGNFTTFNGVTVNNIVRLNSDGTRDTAFTTNTGTGANNDIYGLAIQSDGKIVAVGIFTTFNTVAQTTIVRLNSDGTRDTGFVSGTNFNITSSFSALDVKIQPTDQKIVVAGIFTTYRGTTRNRIARLNTDGTLDTSFVPALNALTQRGVNAIAIQSDGKIICLGGFTIASGVTVNGIARLNTDGTLDTTFATNTGTGTNIGTTFMVKFAVSIQSDEKILIAGDFTTFNGTTVNGIARLNSDGTLDTAFTNNNLTVSNLLVRSLAVKSNNNILFGTTSSFQEINANGTWLSVPGFDGATQSVESIATQPDGKIVVGGDFTTFKGEVVNRIARLNADGTLDTTFDTNIGTGASNQINIVAIQPDGKIVVGGVFTTFNGVTVNRIVRLNSDGTRDTAFTTNTGTAFNGEVRKAIAIQPDGKIVIGGNFTTFNGVTVNRIARLNADGTLDTTFDTNTGTGSAADEIEAIAIQPSGKIVIGGFFVTFNGANVNRIVRLNQDGTRDAFFNLNTGAGRGFDSSVLKIVAQPDGKIVVGGDFTSYRGTLVPTIVRLNEDGTLDTTFKTNTGTGPIGTVNALAIQSDGKIIVGGSFTTFNGITVNNITRLNADGTLDVTFANNTGTGASAVLNTIANQPDGKILIGGDFTSFNSNLAFSIARLGGDVALESFPVEYLVIAGGGSGGGGGVGSGAGGGAGGYRSSILSESSGGGLAAEPILQLQTYVGTTYEVAIGAGAPSVSLISNNARAGNTGTNSSFGSIVSIGGGAGASGSQASTAGGSGGGGSQTTTAASPQSLGTTGQGFSGGALYYGGSNPTAASGGGGGAGSAGSAGSAASGGAGGNGVASSITGVSISRAGGGGGAGAASIPGQGTANSGGGAGTRANNATGFAGTVNTGGGGGGISAGTNTSVNVTSGAGGSGIVILRYPSAFTIIIGAGLTGSTATNGDNKITTITAGTGNVSWVR